MYKSDLVHATDGGYICSPVLECADIWTKGLEGNQAKGRPGGSCCFPVQEYKERQYQKAEWRLRKT